jgi:hypothetical protein
MKKLLRKTVFTLLFALLLLEVLLRLFGTDLGHRIEVFGISIAKPYSVKHWDSVYAPYNDTDFWDSDTIYGGYDEFLGWTLLADRTTANGLYKSNSQGIRANREYKALADSGVFRIAIFGDSFTHGNDVENDSTWPAQLERMLLAKGFNVEVMNFGVMSYGPDQAYLRYLSDGQQYHPELVVLGLQMENIWRLGNAFRPAYIANAGIPLSKPRGVMRDYGLEWLNQPCFDPTLLKDSVVFNFEQSELYDLEYFKDTKFEQSSFLENSYAYLALRKLADQFGDEQINRTDIQSFLQGQEILTELLSTWRAVVENNESNLMLLQLPNEADLRELNTNYTLHYQEYLAEIEAQFLTDFVRTDTLLNKTPSDKLFKGHYTPLGNNLIATYFADRLVQQHALPKLTE